MLSGNASADFKLRSFARLRRAKVDNAFVFGAEKTRPTKSGAGTGISAITRVV
jgi:hypothetical protein